MLKRFYIYVLLATLFAVTQIGMAAHEISHLEDLTSQSQSDHKHSSSEPCTLCLSLSLMAGALPASAFACPVIAVDDTRYHFTSTSNAQSFNSIYAARAPPVSTQL